MLPPSQPSPSKRHDITPILDLGLVLPEVIKLGLDCLNWEQNVLVLLWCVVFIGL